MLLELAGENLRNLQSFAIEPGPHLNLIVGDNAAGKTSLLEAIYILSLGRSFRASRLDDVVCTGKSSAWVRARVKEKASAPTTRLGLARLRARTLCRIDGKTVTSAAEMASHLPVQILHPESHRLLNGSPANRRAFIDWGCFYQDTLFFPTWTRFRRALQQRNAALKRGSDRRTLSSIEHEYCASAQVIDSLRRAYVDSLRTNLTQLAPLWPSEHPWEIEYRRGWSQERTLPESLEREREQARRIGHSLAGPQRADLIIKSAGERVAMVYSRGQLKRAAAALLLAQTQTFEQTSDRQVLVLIDDLPSELDFEARKVLLSTLLSPRRQCFATALSSSDLDLSQFDDSRMFHVKHGRFSELV